MPRRFCVFVVLLTLVASVSPLIAQDTDMGEAGPSGYQVLVRQAVRDYEEQRFGAAIQGFQEAHALSPNARTHRGIGVSALRLQRFQLAHRHLRSSLDDTVQPLSEGLRSRTTEALALAEAQLGHLRVQLDPGVRLLVDGVLETVGPTGELWIMPGPHRLQAAPSDRVGQPGDAFHVVVQAGQVATADLRQAVQDGQGMQAVEPAQVAALADESAGIAESATVLQIASPQRLSSVTVQANEKSPQRSHLGPILLLGAGGASWIAAAITAVLAVGHKRALEDACPQASMCDPEFESRRNQGIAMQSATNVLLGAGALAVGAGALWWAMSPDAEDGLQGGLLLQSDRLTMRLRGSL